MKFYSQVILLSFTSLIIACSGNTDQKEGNTDMTEESVKSSAEGMTSIDLSDYNLNASILIPDESKGKAEIQETEWGSIEIRVGDFFGIEIVPFGLSISDKKTELGSDLVYNIEYLIEDENAILYKKTISESDVEPEFHFFMTTDIEGDLIEVKSISESTFKKAHAEKMFKAAKTLTTNKAEV